VTCGCRGRAITAGQRRSTTCIRGRPAPPSVRTAAASPQRSPSSGPAVAEFYTGTGRAASAPVACPPCVFHASALPWRAWASLADGEVQRSVQLPTSRQYQRRSGQAPPPSGTIWSAGRRMPHIQHDLTVFGSSQNRVDPCWSGMICSPRSLSNSGGLGTGNAACRRQEPGCPGARLRRACPPHGDGLTRL